MSKSEQVPVIFKPATKKEKAIAYAVRQKVEAAVRASMDAESQASKRRELLRKVYRRIFPTEAKPVDFNAVRSVIEELASAILNGWRTLATLDHVAMADAGTREDFEEFEFLINRCAYRLTGIKDIVSQAKNFAETAKQKGMKP